MISIGTVVLYFFLSLIIGSFPTGSVAAHLFGKRGLFEPGERTTMNTGEIFKILGTALGILVTVLDILKGVIVVWPLIIAVIGAEAGRIWWIVGSGGLLVVIGHCNSVFLGFRGGRGLSTTFGVLLALLPVPAFFAFLVWGCLSFWGLSTRPGAVSAAAAMPIFSIPYIWWFHPDKLDFLFTVAFLSLLTMWEHRKVLASYLGLRTSGTQPPPPPEAHC